MIAMVLLLEPSPNNFADTSESPLATSSPQHYDCTESTTVLVVRPNSQLLSKYKKKSGSAPNRIVGPQLACVGLALSPFLQLLSLSLDPEFSTAAPHQKLVAEAQEKEARLHRWL